MRLLKALGAFVGVLIVFAFFDWGQYGFVATLIAIGVAVWVYRAGNEKEPPTAP
jgi:hypothetical protein